MRSAGPRPGRLGSLVRRRPTGRASRGAVDRIGDGVLYGLCMLASLLAVVTIIAIAYKVINGASLSISRFGLGFLAHTAWKPNFGIFGAGVFLFGTAVTSLRPCCSRLRSGSRSGST